MNRTFVPALLAVLGFLVFEQRIEAAHPICGTWRQKSELGESDLKITENLADDGTFDVQEIGLGNAVGTATFKDGVLTVHLYTGDVRGFYKFEVDKEHKKGEGKLLFTHYPSDFQNGEERTIMKKKVREIKGVKLHRVE